MVKRTKALKRLSAGAGAVVMALALATPAAAQDACQNALAALNQAENQSFEGIENLSNVIENNATTPILDTAGPALEQVINALRQIIFEACCGAGSELGAPSCPVN